MASRGQDGALWVKLYELELQLRVMRAARGEALDEVEVEEEGNFAWWNVAAEGTRRGRQYDAYMRRRDARRMMGGVAAAAASSSEEKGQRIRWREARAAAGRPTLLAFNCTGATRDVQEVKRTSAVSIPTTPRKENGALPRARTVNTGASSASGGTAKASHKKRSSHGVVPSDFGESVTPRPFLRRGSGTGAPGRQPPPPAARRHSRSVSELPFHHTAAVLDSPRSAMELPPSQAARARKRWGSPETPRSMLSSSATAAGGDSHNDFTKGLKKLLSFMRKSSSSSKSVHHHCPARHAGKPESTGLSTAATASSPVTAWSLIDGPFDRGSLEGRQFPMTQAVGITG
ncbi:hypothetical protein GUJ93_ZPchr0009g488 [Zizania palustris]|uniref:Uncharacterized protein n=1 Tax=Zizania palustris TaxID=103762 RepID=A0A8J5RMS0_ZIZPA|nr:hypothetical protein GUJ93_ZPchr0009g488 [Zizania palustris]